MLEKKGFLNKLSIPDHKTLDKGLLRSLLRDAQISVEEFKSYLK